MFKLFNLLFFVLPLLSSPLLKAMEAQHKYPSIESLVSQSESECNQYLFDLQTEETQVKLNACRVLEKVKIEVEESAYQTTRDLCYAYKFAMGFEEGTPPPFYKILKSAYLWKQVQQRGLWYPLDKHRELRNLFEEHSFFLYKRTKVKKSQFNRRRNWKNIKYDPNNPDHYTWKDIPVAIDFGDTVGTNYIHYLIGSPGFYYGARACLNPTNSLSLGEEFNRINKFIKVIRLFDYVPAAFLKSTRMAVEFAVGGWAFSLLSKLVKTTTVISAGALAFGLSGDSPQELPFEKTEAYVDAIDQFKDQLSTDIKGSTEFVALPTEKQMQDMKLLVQSYYFYDSLIRLNFVHLDQLNKIETREGQIMYIKNNVMGPTNENEGTQVNYFDSRLYGDALFDCTSQLQPGYCYLDVAKNLEEKMNDSGFTYYKIADQYKDHLFLINQWKINLENKIRTPVEERNLNFLKDAIKGLTEYSEKEFEAQQQFQ